jgi:hypothetical protein
MLNTEVQYFEPIRTELVHFTCFQKDQSKQSKLRNDACCMAMINEIRNNDECGALSLLSENPFAEDPPQEYIIAEDFLRMDGYQEEFSADSLRECLVKCLVENVTEVVDV